MRALVIGASGQVGRALCAAFARDFAVVAASHEHAGPGHLRVDLADAASVDRAFLDARPDVVLLAGGMCNVDRCELEPEACTRVNVNGTREVARHARDSGAKVLFFSTDHVFDGSLGARHEADPVAPLNVYAESKVQAEAILRESLPDRHVILRTSQVYGVDVHRRNFVIRLVDRLREGRSLTVPDDQWGSPTHADDLARAALALLTRGAGGTFHATGPEFVSRLALATRVCERFGLDPALVVARPTHALGQAAKRPLRVRLDCRKLADAGVQPFMTIDSGLQSLDAMLATAPERP